MRSEILQELKKRHDAALTEIGRKPDIHAGVLDHMIAQYLQQHGYQYSLSIYAAESGVETSQAPTPMETLRVLGLNGWPKFVQIVSDALTANGSKGLLMVLLESMAAFLNSVPDGSREDAAAQRYLKQLEGSYVEAIKTFQQEVQEVKAQHTQQIESEVNARMGQFRTQEVDKIKEKEAEQWRSLIQSHRDNLDQAYRTRVDAFKERERQMTEELERHRTEMHQMEQHRHHQLQQGEQFLDEKSRSLERAAADRQSQLETFEQRLHQREQQIAAKGNALHQRLLAWTHKEKQCEIQAHLRAQEQFVNETEVLNSGKLALQSERSKFEMERHEVMSQLEHQTKEHNSMEIKMKRSQELVLQLKENEMALMKRIKRQQSELMEFQKTVLKIHDVPSDVLLLPEASGLDEGSRMGIVKQLLGKLNRATDQMKELKQKLRTEIEKRRKMAMALKASKLTNRKQTQQCQNLGTLAKEAVQETDRVLSRLSASKKSLTEMEQENQGLRSKGDRLQQQLLCIRLRSSSDRIEDLSDEMMPLPDSFLCPLVNDMDHLSFSRRRSRFDDLETEERNLQTRLAKLKEQLKTTSQVPLNVGIDQLGTGIRETFQRDVAVFCDEDLDVTSETMADTICPSESPTDSCLSLEMPKSIVDSPAKTKEHTSHINERTSQPIALSLPVPVHLPSSNTECVDSRNVHGVQSPSPLSLLTNIPMDDVFISSQPFTNNAVFGQHIHGASQSSMDRCNPFLQLPSLGEQWMGLPSADLQEVRQIGQPSWNVPTLPVPPKFAPLFLSVPQCQTVPSLSLPELSLHPVSDLDVKRQTHPSNNRNQKQEIESQRREVQACHSANDFEEEHIQPATQSSKSLIELPLLDTVEDVQDLSRVVEDDHGSHSETQETEPSCQEMDGNSTMAVEEVCSHASLSPVPSDCRTPLNDGVASCKPEIIEDNSDSTLPPELDGFDSSNASS